MYHRDLNPENLFLSDDKQLLKSPDFRLSSIKASNSSCALLHTVMCTPHYIVPEIITSEPVGYDSAKVDAWPSGVILFGMPAGYFPFYEQVTLDLYRAIFPGQVPYPPHFPYDAIKHEQIRRLKCHNLRLTRPTGRCAAAAVHWHHHHKEP